MKKILFILLSTVILFSCSDEDKPVQNPFVIAFEDTSANFLKIPDYKEVKLIFSEEAQFAGEVKLKVASDNLIYGEDFTTLPAIKNEELVLPFQKGDKEISFRFNNLMKDFSTIDSDKSILFTIQEINYKGKHAIQGYTTYDISYDIKVSGDFEPNVGGPTEPNQVYMDLSAGETKIVKRNTWDLGFYSGEEFRVILNGSLYMATTALDGNNIDSFTKNNITPELFEKVRMGTFDPNNAKYVDNPSGDLKGTAIAEINANDSENKVYLLNLGSKVPENIDVRPGSAPVSGKPRGWKKIRILRKGEGYLLQYADLDDTTHKEIEIPKKKEYNFNFVSLESNAIVEVQPPKQDWDICYTVFTNVIPGAGSYGYSDFVVNNIFGNAHAFQVEETAAITYKNYQLNVTEAEANLSDDQRAIGSSWRSVFNGGSVYPNKFYVIKDPEGNWYKIKFLALTNTSGMRGYPRLKYELLPIR